MVKKIYSCALLVYSLCALQSPDQEPADDISAERFKEQVLQLKHASLKIRGKVLGLELAMFDIEEKSRAEARFLLGAYMVQAIRLERLASENCALFVLPEYNELLRIIDQLRSLESRMLQQRKSEAGSCGFYVNPFK